LLISPIPTLTVTLTPSPTVAPTLSPVITRTKTPSITLAKRVVSPMQKKTMRVTQTQKIPKHTSFPNLFAGFTNNAAFLTKMLDLLVFIIFCITLGLGFLKSTFFEKITNKQIKQNSNQSSKILQPKTVDNTFFVKLQQVDANGQWVILVDGDTQLAGYYQGKKIKEGFVKIKGELKETNGKEYILISEILPAV